MVRHLGKAFNRYNYMIILPARLFLFFFFFFPEVLVFAFTKGNCVVKGCQI